MQKQFLLTVNEVVKQYGSYLASDHISFEMPKGSILGMLGPNGAGKSTLIRIITGITMADKGEVQLLGEPINEKNRLTIGYMPEERGLYKKMKVGEQLVYLARLRGLTRLQAHDRIRYWFDRLGMQGWGDKKTDDLSKGMQQKVQFVATVLHDPKLIILDEPFSGLDPINANLLKEEIMYLNQQGAGIIFSTHRMEQVEEMCHNIVLINQGQNILYGPVKEIRESYKENLFELLFTGLWPEQLPEGIEINNLQPEIALVRVENGVSTNLLLQHLVQKKVQIQGFREVLPSLNDVFIKRVEEFGLSGLPKK